MSPNRDYCQKLGWTGQLEKCMFSKCGLLLPSSTAYGYHPDGKVNWQAFTGGVTTSYGYDGRGMINSVTHKNGSGQSLASRESWRDERDRILAWKRGPSGGVNGMEDGRGDRYEYDEEGQLKKASYRAATPESSPTGALRSDEFQYDELGNRAGTNWVASRGVMNFERKDNGLNQYRGWWPYSITNYDDDLEGWGEPGEANGVMMQDGWITASFTALNQPMGMWSPAYNGTANNMWFGYDPLGRCVKRWKGPEAAGTPGYNPATYFYYDGWNMVQEGLSAASTDRTYVYGGRVDEIVASQVSGVWYNHHYDAQGNAILLSSTTGGLVEQYDYDAFGWPYFYNAIGGKGGNPKTRFLFTGREWINDMRLYDYRHRMYQPELGRFLQPDPKQFEAGDYNIYRYCHNDPVNRSDPFGLGPDEEMLTSDPVARDEIISAVNAQAAKAWEQFKSETLEMLQNPSSLVGPGRIGMARSPRGPLNSLLGKIFPSFRRDAILGGLAGPRTGNFGLGSATRADATSAGRTWVGSGFRVASDGKTLVSRDGLRQYRPPTFKPNLNKVQANFEQRSQPEGPWKSNGHLDITD
jgi:RHS repeat-associated protein